MPPCPQQWLPCWSWACALTPDAGKPFLRLSMQCTPEIVCFDQGSVHALRRSTAHLWRGLLSVGRRWLLHELVQGLQRRDPGGRCAIGIFTAFCIFPL